VHTVAVNVTTPSMSLSNPLDEALARRVQRVLQALEAIAPLRIEQRQALERDLSRDEETLRGMEILLAN
jgi:hypothetical protein